jgi:hypothetical protein
MRGFQGQGLDDVAHLGVVILLLAQVVQGHLGGGADVVDRGLVGHQRVAALDRLDDLFHFAVAGAAAVFLRHRGGAQVADARLQLAQLLAATWLPEPSSSTS